MTYCTCNSVNTKS